MDVQANPLTRDEIATLRAVNGNGVCADCYAPNPDWVSINLGYVRCLIVGPLGRDYPLHHSLPPPHTPFTPSHSPPRSRIQPAYSFVSIAPASTGAWVCT